MLSSNRNDIPRPVLQFPGGTQHYLPVFPQSVHRHSGGLSGRSLTPLQPRQHVADRFGDRWNIPHACGALNGKHMATKKPKDSGTLYYKYKGFFSIVLLALVDADYKFVWADVGANGSASDCGVYNCSELEPGLREDTINLTDPSPLPNDDQDMPYFIVGHVPSGHT